MNGFSIKIFIILAVGLLLVMCFCFILFVKQNCLSFNALRSISICQFFLKIKGQFSYAIVLQFIFIMHACIYIAYSGYILSRLTTSKALTVCIDVRYLYEVGNKISCCICFEGRCRLSCH